MATVAGNKPIHLVVLQHGLHGTPFLLRAFKERIETLATSADENLVVLLISSNSTFLATHDGIDACGKRLVAELEDFTSKAKIPAGSRLSVVGHSLGGLILRYALGLMYQRGLITTHYVPHIFATFASPHLGASDFRWGWFRPLVGLVLAYFTGKTGPQLAFADKTEGSDPLLLQMTTGPYLEALRLFKRRIVYANLTQDYQVPFETAALLPYNSLTDFSRLEYYPNYPHVVSSPPVNRQQFSVKPDSPVHLKALSHLDQVEWIRHAAHFANPLGHDMIVGKFPFLPGADVTTHFIQTYFK